MLKKRTAAIIGLMIASAVLLMAQTAILRVGKLNNVRKCDYTGYAGSTAGARIATCLLDFPVTGGIADAQGFEGAQTLPSTLTVPSKVTLVLGSASFSYAGTGRAILLSDGANLICTSPTNTSIIITGSASDGINPEGHNRIEGCDINGPGYAADAAGFTAIDFGGNAYGDSDDIVIRGNTIRNWKSHCVNTGGFSRNITIEDNTFDGCRHDGVLASGGALKVFVKNNRFFNISSWALDCGGCSKSVWTGNIGDVVGTVYGPSGDGGGISVFGYTDGGNTFNADDNVFTDNIFTNVVGRGHSSSAQGTASVSNNKYKGNTFLSDGATAGIGMFMNAAMTATSVDNEYTGNKASGFTVGTDGTGFYIQNFGASVSRTKVHRNDLSGNDYGWVTEGGILDSEFIDNNVRNSGTSAFLDSGTRTIKVNSKDDSADAYYTFASGVELSDIKALTSSLVTATSTGNTGLCLDSTAGGVRNYCHLVDTSGNWSLQDVDGGPAVRLIMSSAGVFTINGSTVLGTGSSPINSVKAISFNLDIASTATATSSSANVTFTGCSNSMPVVIAPAQGGSFGDGTLYAWCSAANTIRVTFSNLTGSTIDPGNQGFIAAQFVF